MLPNVKQVVIGRGHSGAALISDYFSRLSVNIRRSLLHSGDTQCDCRRHLRQETRMSFRKLLVALEFGARSALGCGDCSGQL